MKIKKKFSIFIVLILIFNLFTILSFYYFYLKPSNTINFEFIQNFISSENIHLERGDLLNFINIHISDMVNKMILFDLFFILFCLVLSSVFVYIIFIKPLGKLTSNIENYKINPHLLTKSSRKDEIGILNNLIFSLINQIELEQKNQINMIASISHDIKTPLTSIMGYSERLLNYNISDDKKKVYLNTIYSKSKIIDNLVNDFDEFLSFKLEHNLTLNDYDISYLCSLLETEYALELNDINIEFQIINNCSNHKISLDLIKFKRVIGNIIDNSIKSIKKSNVIGKIEFNIYEENGNVIFSISDNGQGVDNNIIDTIFDPLFTTDYSRKVAGFGLAICKNIILAHGGDIYAKNLSNGGFQINIILKK